MSMFNNTKHTMHNGGRLLACLVVAASAAGCGDAQQVDTQQPTATRSVLNAEMLNAALEEQSSFEAAGVNLRARAWLRPDAYVAEYQTTAGAMLGTQRIGKGSVLDGQELPMLTRGESFDDFARRAKAAGAMHVAELSADQIWFQVDPDAVDELKNPTGIAKVNQASTLEDVARALAACNSMAINSCLNETVGYIGPGGGPPPRPVFRWAFTAGGSMAQSGSGGASIGSGTGFGLGRGSAAYSAMCAGSVTATLKFTVANARFGIMTLPRITVFADPLGFFGLVIGEGWNNSRCSALDPTCNYKLDFNQADFTFVVSPGNNLETFCGQVTDQRQIKFAEPCDPLFGHGCPDFSFPSAFDGESVAN